MTKRLLYDFSVQREIETVALGILRNAQADEHLDHGEDDQAGDGIIDEDDGDADALIEELTDVSLQNARCSAVLLDREHPGQQRPDDAANRVHAEAIQRIVIAEDALQAGASPVAADARTNSDGKGTDRSHKTGRADDYTWLCGQLQYWPLHKSWRLRYAGLDEVDLYGGSVTLADGVSGADVKDGQYVRVEGRLIEPAVKSIAPAYAVESIHALDK